MTHTAEPTALTTIAERRCFGGVQGVYAHASRATRTTMRLAVYRPPQAERGPVPTLTFLSGLTCTEANFTEKAGAQRWAAEHGVMLVAPDTSPRGLDLPGEHDTWDFGSGAGFYVDATEAPWATNYRMYSYVTQELPALIDAHFPSIPERRGITGHSMGGHGALVIGLRNPELYRSVSAFSPICAPSKCPWGQRAFTGYLGADPLRWRSWDASALLQDGADQVEALFVDQGTADELLATQLMPEVLEEAAAKAGVPLLLRRQPGYDHSYYFIATFIGDHVRWHAEMLAKL